MIPRLHLVTHDAVLAQPRFATTVEAVLERCGATAALHVRGHATRSRDLYDIAAAASAAALRTGAWLIINDRVDIARAVRANGVQLGSRSIGVADARAVLGAGARIGYSVHAAAEAAAAAALGADWVFAGSIYDSASHPGAEPTGLALLDECVGSAGIPVIAIGGITPARVSEVARAGAYGVAVLGGVWHAGDACGAVEEYVEQIRSWP